MALTLTPRASELTFQPRTGIGIAYPFLKPTGTDTGTPGTSSYDTSPYTDPASFATHVGSWLTAVAGAAGFDHVRLMVNVGPIIECNVNSQSSRKATLLGQITGALDVILAAGLKCYVSLHLTGFVSGYDAARYLDGVSGTYYPLYKAMLLDVAGALASYDPTQTALEIFNEPPDPSAFTGDYPTMLGDMQSTLRQALPAHTLIATCAGASTPDNLVAFDPSGFDKNTLWAFHWYPLSSVQGLPSSALGKYLGGADWETRIDQRPAILSSVTTNVNNDSSVTAPNKTTVINAVMAAYDVMVTRGRAYIDSQVAAVRTWAANRNVSVICSEYGITQTNPGYAGMPEASRLLNMRDIDVTLTKYALRRTVTAPDSIDFHMPGDVTGPKTLDVLTAPWLAALMANAGFLNAAGS